MIGVEVFGGADPGRWGGVARLVGEVEGDDLRIREAALFPMPVRERDDGGHEVDARGLAAIVWGLEHTRLVIERPAAGGAMKRGAMSVIAQGALFGQALSVLQLTDSPVDQVLASVSTRRELGLPTVPRGGDRKAANLADAEALLARLGCEVRGPPPTRGYPGRIGGCKESRSGMADALLLAWLGARRWLGEGRRRR